MTQAYDIGKTYQFNYDCGPTIDLAVPEIPATPLKDFLGMKVNSRLGISAGILLNSRWIEAYSARGFDILTYKTVRTIHRPCHPMPNWVFVDDYGDREGPAYLVKEPPKNPAEASFAVCFGMPSVAPPIWRNDVQRAKDALRPGQMLIVSVVATPTPGATPEMVTADYVKCAQWAAEAGADVIEVNLSCPNVCTAEGSIYLDPEYSQRITKAIRDVIGQKPLLLKIGYVYDKVALRRLLQFVNGIANGVTLVNTISREVLNEDGTPVFGKDYSRAGVLGRVIHKPCVRMVAETVAMIQELWLDLVVVAVGGVSRPQDAKDFFDAGASAVLMGSSPSFLPNLAADLKRHNPEW